MEILDGKLTSQNIKNEITAEVERHVKAGKRVPHLAAILVGESGASVTYVNAKIKDCESIGFRSTLIALPESTSEAELLNRIAELNADPELDGYIVQLPLPKHINENNVTQAIAPEKDVDGFHPVNVGKMTMGMDTFLPATPYGIMELLERYAVPTSGKHCVVIGRSNIVGRPMSILMSANRNPGNCTVTLTHSKTTNLKEICLQADIIVAALGKPEFLTGDMVKEGAAVIDVGITRVEDARKKSGFRLSGDVHYESVAPKCIFITPVPGGVGPMTRAALLMNTMRAYRINMSEH